LLNNTIYLYYYSYNIPNNEEVLLVTKRMWIILLVFAIMLSMASCKSNAEEPVNAISNINSGVLSLDKSEGSNLSGGAYNI